MSKDKMNSDEEYQYPQDEYVTDSEETINVEENDEEEISNPKPESPIKQFLVKNKRLVIGCSAGILLLLAFQIMNHGKKQKVTKPTKVATTEEEVVKLQPSKPVVDYKPVQQNGQLAQSLQSIQNSGVSNNQEIQRLKLELRTLQGQLDEANRTNQQLRDAMGLLLQEVKKINTRLDQKNSEKPAPQAGRAQVTYSIHALVNGRAWIISSDGLSRSVTVGDTIQGYGTVSEIDPNRGIVITSSGKVIRYGTNDY